MKCPHDCNGCTCHISPPCGHCVEHYCPKCEDFNCDCEEEPEKAIEAIPLERESTFDKYMRLTTDKYEQAILKLMGVEPEMLEGSGLENKEDVRRLSYKSFYKAHRREEVF